MESRASRAPEPLRVERNELLLDFIAGDFAGVALVSPHSERLLRTAAKKFARA